MKFKYAILGVLISQFVSLRVPDSGVINHNHEMEHEKSEEEGFLIPRKKQASDVSIDVNDGLAKTPNSIENSSTNFNMYDYFYNLTDYSPMNDLGSSGFVSLIQAMSYYDTFENDNIIPDDYDYYYTQANTEAEVNPRSPGVLRDSYFSSGYSSYYQYCHNTFNYNFQSRLTVEQNIMHNSNNPTYFTYNPSIYYYQDILNRLYGNVTSVIVRSYFVRPESPDQEKYQAIIKAEIDKGNPVIVDVSNNIRDFHTVVAYDYDDQEIYANYGGSASNNHEVLAGPNARYSYLYHVVILDFSNIGHRHSNNYMIDKFSYCGCNGFTDADYEVHSHLIKPADYGFGQVYNLKEITGEHVIDNIGFTTKRLRAGNIEGNQVVLSARNNDAGIAYLEYGFNVPITRINVDLALWSDNESLKPSDCTAVIQYKSIRGVWITKLNLLKDIKLSTDRTKPGNYTIFFNAPVTEFRIYSTAPKTNASNSGRLCVGNMEIVYYSPHLLARRSIKFNTLQHLVYCLNCDYSKFEVHIFISDRIGNRCILCKYSLAD